MHVLCTRPHPHLWHDNIIGERHMNHTPRSVKPHYRDSIIRAPPLPPVDSRATRAEVGQAYSSSEFDINIMHHWRMCTCSYGRSHYFMSSRFFVDWVFSLPLQRKAHAVVEQLLKSEAAFLSSLNIAMEVTQTHYSCHT